jgi:hypothetical protein
VRGVRRMGGLAPRRVPNAPFTTCTAMSRVSGETTASSASSSSGRTAGRVARATASASASTGGSATAPDAESAPFPAGTAGVEAFFCGRRRRWSSPLSYWLMMLIGRDGRGRRRREVVPVAPAAGCSAAATAVHRGRERAACRCRKRVHRRAPTSGARERGGSALMVNFLAAQPKTQNFRSHLA